MEKPHCKQCGGKMQSRGTSSKFIFGIGTQKKQFFCSKCSSWHYEPPRHSRPARIILVDIETIPGVYYAFDPKVDYLSPENQIKHRSIVCWAAKWLFDEEIMGQVVTPKEAIDRRDGSILKGIWDLVNEADVVVTQNGISFDMKMLNTEWLLYGHKRPSHYLNVDTLLTARKTFNFEYNRLDELGERLGIGRKTKMVFQDWINCSNGEPEALEKMFNYCKRDVAPLLEDVYLHMLPWMDDHPNMNIFAESTNGVCRNCGSTDLNWETETYKTPQGLWNAWRCRACNSIGRGTSKVKKIRGTQVK